MRRWSWRRSSSGGRKTFRRSRVSPEADRNVCPTARGLCGLRRRRGGFSRKAYHAIAASALSFVQSLVGALDEIGGGLDGDIHLADAEAARDADGGAAAAAAAGGAGGAELQGGDGDAQALGEGNGLGAVEAGGE